VILRSETKGFGQEVKERDARDRASRETEYQMELIAEFERERPANESSNRRGQGNE
jgi:hypothetical protein